MVLNDDWFMIYQQKLSALRDETWEICKGKQEWLEQYCLQSFIQVKRLYDCLAETSSMAAHLSAVTDDLIGQLKATAHEYEKMCTEQIDTFPLELQQHLGKVLLAGPKGIYDIALYRGFTEDAIESYKRFIWDYLYQFLIPIGQNIQELKEKHPLTKPPMKLPMEMDLYPLWKEIQYFYDDFHFFDDLREDRLLEIIGKPSLYYQLLKLRVLLRDIALEYRD